MSSQETLFKGNKIQSLCFSLQENFWLPKKKKSEQKIWIFFWLRFVSEYFLCNKFKNNSFTMLPALYHYILHHTFISVEIREGGYFFKIAMGSLNLILSFIAFFIKELQYFPNFAKDWNCPSCRILIFLLLIIWLVMILTFYMIRHKNYFKTDF